MVMLSCDGKDGNHKVQRDGFGVCADLPAGEQPSRRTADIPKNLKAPHPACEDVRLPLVTHEWAGSALYLRAVMASSAFFTSSEPICLAHLSYTSLVAFLNSAISVSVGLTTFTPKPSISLIRL